MHRGIDNTPMKNQMRGRFIMPSSRSSLLNQISPKEKDANKTGSSTSAATVLNSNGEITQELVVGVQYGARWLVDPKDLRDGIVQPIPNIVKRLNVLQQHTHTRWWWVCPLEHWMWAIKVSRKFVSSRKIYLVQYVYIYICTLHLGCQPHRIFYGFDVPTKNFSVHTRCTKIKDFKVPMHECQLINLNPFKSNFKRRVSFLFYLTCFVWCVTSVNACWFNQY